MRKRDISAEFTTRGQPTRPVDSIDSTLNRPWSVAPEDLSREMVLGRCARVTFAGAPRPALGDFPLLAKIGHGGMGVVYFGVHPRLETEVAVKILPSDAQARQPELVRRFLREARVAARMNSDFLVRVFDVDRDRASGLYYLVMEYVRGIPAGRWLDDAVARGAQGVPEEAALDVCIAATRGLSAAHERGTIHRDVKPDNILIPTGPDGPLFAAAKLADLGLAGADESSQPRDERLTGTRITLMGTPGYAAPEQLEDPTKAKKPADVFSMGATVYALLTGRGPYSRGATMESVLATLKGGHRPLRDARPATSPGTIAMVELCLNADPVKRYPDAAALLEALQLCREACARGTGAPRELTTDVVRLAQRSEVGESVQTDPSGAPVTSGRLEVEGGPAGAHITLRRRGTSPLAYAGVLDADGRFSRDHVESGTYDMTAARTGYHPYSAKVDVSASSVAVARLSMRERDGIVALDSEPHGAEVSVDGAPVGVTPIPALAVPPGSHTIALTLAGHDRAVRTVVVRGGATTQLGVVVLEALGRVDLAAAGDDVQFELDGKAVRGTVELSPGTYRFVARRDGFEPQETEVVVAAAGASAPALTPWRRHGWSLLSDLDRWDATTPADRRRVARTIVEKLPDFSLRAMETFESGGASHEVAVLVHQTTGLEFVLVPGGRVAMGSAPEEPGRRPDERRHSAVTAPFLMARTPVPQAAWEAAMRTNPSHFRGPSLPVERVSHTEAAEFCARLHLSLPTETQWEYACRAGSRAAWSFGDDAADLAAHAWFAGNAADGPRPVGSRRPNAFGLFDLHGNVWEWCAAPYAEYPFDGDAAAAAEPAGAPSYRVFRGGGWSDPPERLRSAQRAAFRPDYRFSDLGLRPVRELTPDLGQGRSVSSVSAKAVTAATAPVPRPTAAGTALVDDVTRWDAATPEERRRAADEAAGESTAFELSSVAAFEAGGAAHEVAILVHRATGMEFVLVPGGALPVVASARQTWRSSGPAGRERVGPMLVARTPVTQAVWKRITGANSSFYVGDDLPVEQVDLPEAAEFCARLGLALPSEAQWEYACRGGTASAWCCGDESALPEFAWFEKNAGRSTHPVGQKRPNAFGLFDVMGNVWEWCAPEPGGDPTEGRIRGGGWTSEARQLQSSWFLSYPSGTRMGILGLRPVRPLWTKREGVA